MTQGGNLPAAQLEQRRARTIQALTDHFARDHLSLEEFETRVEQVYRATTPRALDEVTAGLPALEVADAPAPAASLAPVPKERTLFAMWSAVQRHGQWIVPQKVNAIAVMGGVELDLRQAVLQPGITEIEVFALMGGVEIVVPPSVRLETDGMAIMGSFEDRVLLPTSGDPLAQTVRVTGIAIMGGVEVKVARRSLKGARSRDDMEDESS
ncbi:MAG TPA: DUF1707 domain-containing protein [Gemmatimonadaceae bacterium]|nr:DUF1707 domain-containing protein [Gemmatimonadaceae bacterium]